MLVLKSLHLAFDFSPCTPNGNVFLKRFGCLSDSTEHPTWVWSNHDFPRQSKRWGKHPNRAKLMIALQLLLKGTPVLYYGEEIDQPHVNLAKRDIVDPPGKRFYPFYKGRDGARTPIIGGTALGCHPKPWLPVSGSDTVKIERNDTDSVLNWCRCLIALRRQHVVLRQGDIQWDNNGFWRIDSQSRWYIAVNWTSGCSVIATNSTSSVSQDRSVDRE